MGSLTTGDVDVMDCGCRELELGEREEELEALSDKVKVRPHFFSNFSIKSSVQESVYQMTFW